MGCVYVTKKPRVRGIQREWASGQINRQTGIQTDRQTSRVR